MPPLPSPNSDSVIRFIDRREAGARLAEEVLAEFNREPALSAYPVVVYALPRGGLPIAAPIARALNCPLDVIVAKKITRSDNTELAIGAVTADGHVVWAASPGQKSGSTALAPDRSARLQPQQAMERAQTHAQAQLADLTAHTTHVSAQNAIALVVDDGIATGMTMAAAVQAVQAQNPHQVWICSPVAPQEIMPFLYHLGDRAIILETPHPFYSVSRFYQEFPQVSTEEAAAFLQ